MPVTEFEVKSHELDKETLYRLDDAGLNWSNVKVEGRMAYEDIASVHLMVFSSNYGRGRLCRIKDRSGRKRVFRSLHCFSPGTIEDRIAGYGSFVRELLVRLAEKAPGARFTRGSTFDFVALIIGLVILVGSGGIVLFAAFGANLSPDPMFLGFFAFIVFTIPLVLGYLKRRRPRTFDPRDPPRELVENESEMS